MTEALDSWTTITSSPDETERIAMSLAPLLSSPLLITLYGDLAAGKTCFVRGLARERRQDGAVSSPTFTIVNEYGGDPPFSHIDLYRLSGTDEMLEMGLPELLSPVVGICAVEWAERAKDLLPPKRLDIFFEHGDANRRLIRIENRGALPADWTTRLEDALTSSPS